MAEPAERAELAERAARAGGEVARESFRRDLEVGTKRDKNDLVTDADFAAQRAVLAAIADVRPGEVVVCEEDDGDDPSGGPVSEEATVVREAVPDDRPAWVVDPIDGTANYARGSRLWATCVAAVVDGDPVGAATHQPALGDTYVAGPEDARRNGEALSVSDRTDPETFAVGLLGWWPAEARDAYVATFETAVSRFGDVRRIGSMQTVLAMVAEGSLEAAFVPARPDPWDTIAGALLVRRAGGTVTDLAGEPWTRDSAALVASNGTAHDVACAVARAGADLEYGD